MRNRLRRASFTAEYSRKGIPWLNYFCRITCIFFRGNAVVFLDLNQDDYTFVGETEAAALRWLSSSKIEANSLQLSHALKGLIDGGLLTTDRNAGRPVAPTIDAPASEPGGGAFGANICTSCLALFRCQHVGLCSAAMEPDRKTIVRVQRRKAHRAPSSPITSTGRENSSPSSIA